MKRVFLILLVIVLGFIILSYFIPATDQREMPINNTFENIASSLSHPKNWVKWDASVRAAWQKDSSACRFREDTVKHEFIIDVPGKKIIVTEVAYLSYLLEEKTNDKTEDVVLSILPFVGNKQPGSYHNSKISYALNSNLLYKTFRFLKGSSSGEKTLSDLGSYLNNQDRFYGFPIKIIPASDTLFITREDSMTRKELFKKLHGLFDTLDQYCRKNHLQPGNRNVYYSSLPHDSLKLLAGININKMISGENKNQFMEMPPGQILAVTYFEGPFRDRPKVYEAMKKYISDKQLIRFSVCFEKYLSPLPASDSSIIKMELAYPIRSY
jgi:hypothetical protein